jgi:uncharacterized protein YndB with AHSA1/START domain
MSRNTRILRCSPEDVFRVLEDGWLFPAWVVGASRMRDVGEDWPRTGSRLHHSFGTWPLLLDDATEVLDYEPPRRLILKARGWPIGEARVTIHVKPHAEGSLVRIQEEAIAGPGRLIPQPLLDIPLQLRNAETLHRLAYLAEGMARGDQPRTTAEDEDATTRGGSQTR